MKIVVKWLFDNEEEARSAIDNLIEEMDGAICSCGVTDKQGEGFNIRYGEIEYSKHPTSKCVMTWSHEEMDVPGLWISGVLFERHNTYDEELRNLKGEAFYEDVSYE
jgi:hypothetical protein